MWRRGGVFQEWSEHFDLDLWTEAMANHGLSIDWYVQRHRTEDEILPWDHLSAGLHKDFLWQDWQDALREQGLPDCRWTPCYDCGACTDYGIEHIVASAVPPAGGSQGTGQDLARGADVPVRFMAPAPAGGSDLTMKVRLRFSKLGKIRFISHRDVARIWERALRRAELPVAYTEGFSPRPKLSFGLALPTGHESLGEYLDVDLATVTEDPIDVDRLPARLDSCLPVGLDAQGAAVIEPGTPSLQQAVTSCTWRIEVTGTSAERLAALVERGLAADELPATRIRKGREESIDLRPAVRSAEVVGASDRGAIMVAELATQPRSARPSDLVAVLGADLDEGLVCRTHQWILVDGARTEPVPLTATLAAAPSPHAEARAS